MFSLKLKPLNQSANRSHTLSALRAAKRAASRAGRVGSGRAGSRRTETRYPRSARRRHLRKLFTYSRLTRVLPSITSPRSTMPTTWDQRSVCSSMNSSASRSSAPGSSPSARNRWIRSSVKPGVVTMVMSRSSRRGAHPGLFFQLPRGAALRALARVEPSGRHLPDEAVRRVAELPDEQDPGIGRARRVEEGNHRRGAGMAKDLELADGVVGEADGVQVEVDDAAGVEARCRDEGHGGKGG